MDLNDLGLVNGLVKPTENHRIFPREKVGDFSSEVDDFFNGSDDGKIFGNSSRFSHEIWGVLVSLFHCSHQSIDHEEKPVLGDWRFFWGK